MSDLYKKALNQGKPPKPVDEGEADEEELKDDMPQELPDPTEKFPFQMGREPIKPTQHFAMPPPPPSAAHAAAGQHKIHDYSALQWQEFFDSQDFMDNGTPVYRAGNEGCIFFCLHGAGDSALSFARLSQQIRQFASVVSFDFRGHGDSKVAQNADDLSLNTLLIDCEEVLRWVVQKWPEPTIVIVGHSMGGAIASKFTERALHTDLAAKIQGLIVIDVVEGTAIEALPFMEQIVKSRPTHFTSLEQLIKWSVHSMTLRNLQSARVSMPPKVVPTTDHKGQPAFTWKVDLLKSQTHWLGWFQGLTQSFLSIRVPKLLMLAEKERMDKDLTIAQMQGRFRLVVLHETGHYMMEDDFKGTASQFHLFLQQFRLPKTQTELNELRQVGVGKFHPVLKPFK